MPGAQPAPPVKDPGYLAWVTLQDLSFNGNLTSVKTQTTYFFNPNSKFAKVQSKSKKTKMACLFPLTEVFWCDRISTRLNISEFKIIRWLSG